MSDDRGGGTRRKKQPVLQKEKHREQSGHTKVRGKALHKEPSVRGDMPSTRTAGRQDKAANPKPVRRAVKPYPAWACLECGKTHGRGMPKDHVFTIHYGKCDVCNKNNFVTEPRDFGHFPRWFT